jgi:PQQ-dependent dehydrogenase (methanol/ethanol family)
LIQQKGWTVRFWNRLEELASSAAFVPTGNHRGYRLLAAARYGVACVACAFEWRCAIDESTRKGGIKMMAKRTVPVWGVLLGFAVVPGFALANQDVIKLSQDAKNWAMQAGNMQNQRYSGLKQINKDNVKNMRVAWTFSTGVLRGHEGGPLVIGDTLYIHSPFPNKVFAINLADQSIKWRYEPKQDPTVIPVMCCDTVNRGLAYAEGKIFLQQADTTLVALDAKTGKELWKVKNGDPKRGETNTNAPHVFKDKVITGISGGEFGVRGYVAAYDINTGKQVWKGYSTGPDAEMLMDPAKTMTWTNGKLAPVGKDSSLKTWEGDRRRHHVGVV